MGHTADIMDTTTTLKAISKDYNNLACVLDCLQNILQLNIRPTASITENLISTDFLDEIKSFMSTDNILLYFGKSLRELKCRIIDQDYMREHYIDFLYKGPNKLLVTAVSFPSSFLLDQEYRTIQELVSTYKKHLDELSGYFHELECIDRCCSVMEPLNPTFKEDYRRILLDDRTWLHIEVTAEGLATNIHLIGQSEYWQDKLQSGLLKWDHDMDIVRNIMSIFDISEFPTPANRSSVDQIVEDKSVEAAICSICLCDKLPDITGVPLPLCQNPTCGVNFHRACLYQWLVACSGGRPPAFGVATGSCPSCLQPITCNEKDS